MVCNLKTAGCGVKMSEICDSGVLATSIWGTFDLFMFNVILGSLGCSGGRVVSYIGLPPLRVTQPILRQTYVGVTCYGL